jgi:hypothetical protein
LDGDTAAAEDDWMLSNLGEAVILVDLNTDPLPLPLPLPLPTLLLLLLLL